MDSGGFRARSVPSGRSNPFWSDRVQADVQLDAARPAGLPPGAFDEFPIQNSPGDAGHFRQGMDAPTGKGRGGQQTAGAMPLEPRPTEQGAELERTEGRLPVDAKGNFGWALQMGNQ